MAKCQANEVRVGEGGTDYEAEETEGSKSKGADGLRDLSGATWHKKWGLENSHVSRVHGMLQCWVFLA